MSKEDKTFYMVYVEKNNPPKKKHKTLKSATDEAERLHKLHEGKYNVHVLTLFATLDKTVIE